MLAWEEGLDLPKIAEFFFGNLKFLVGKMGLECLVGKNLMFSFTVLDRYVPNHG